MMCAGRSSFQHRLACLSPLEGQPVALGLAFAPRSHSNAMRRGTTTHEWNREIYLIADKNLFRDRTTR